MVGFLAVAECLIEVEIRIREGHDRIDKDGEPCTAIGLKLDAGVSLLIGKGGMLGARGFLSQAAFSALARPESRSGVPDE